MNLSHCNEKLLEQRIPAHQISSAQVRRRKFANKYQRQWKSHWNL